MDKKQKIERKQKRTQIRQLKQKQTFDLNRIRKEIHHIQYKQIIRLRQSS